MQTQYCHLTAKADTSLLPLYKDLLTEKDFNTCKDMEEIQQFRWITSMRRVDWHKFFAANVDVNFLVIQAACSVPGNPVAFLKPEWVDTAIHRYTNICPANVKNYAANFKNCAIIGDVEEMKSWFEIIENFA